MKALNRAFEVLTGVDPHTLTFEENDITYFVRTKPQRQTEQLQRVIYFAALAPRVHPERHRGARSERRQQQRVRVGAEIGSTVFDRFIASSSIGSNGA